MAKIKDAFTQRIAQSCALSAVADGDTFVAITDSFKPEDQTGWVIQEVSYAFEPEVQGLLNTTGDRVKYGLTFISAAPGGGHELDDSGIIDWNSIGRLDVAALAADVMVLPEWPKTKDFSNLKGGGILVHPVNLYVFTYPDAALSASGILHVELKYFAIDLTPELYKDLWQGVWVRRT